MDNEPDEIYLCPTMRGFFAEPEPAHKDDIKYHHDWKYQKAIEALKLYSTAEVHERTGEYMFSIGGELYEDSVNDLALATLKELGEINE